MNKYISICGSLFLCTQLLTGCTDFSKTVVSPNGTHTLQIDYDFASCPTVYEKKRGSDVLLWSYQGAGFTETTFVSVEWTGEDTVDLTFADETVSLYLGEGA